MHVYVQIEPRWSFTEVRRAAVAIYRNIETASSGNCKFEMVEEGERHGVFLDYNQNAKDRTTCSAYSVRAVADARVSTPLSLEPDCDPAEFTTRHNAQPFCGDRRSPTRE